MSASAADWKTATLTVPDTVVSDAARSDSARSRVSSTGWTVRTTKGSVTKRKASVTACEVLAHCRPRGEFAP